LRLGEFFYCWPIASAPGIDAAIEIAYVQSLCGQGRRGVLADFKAMYAVHDDRLMARQIFCPIGNLVWVAPGGAGNQMRVRVKALLTANIDHQRSDRAANS
jgi:hypothetical protein